MDAIRGPGSRSIPPSAPEGREREARVQTYREPVVTPKAPSTIGALARLHADIVTIGGEEATAGAPGVPCPADPRDPAGAPRDFPGWPELPGSQSPAAVKARLIELFLAMAQDAESRRRWDPLTGTDPDLPPEPLPAEPRVLAHRMAADAQRQAFAERVTREGFHAARALTAAEEPAPAERLVPGVATPTAARAPSADVLPSGATMLLAASMASGTPLHPRAARWVHDPARPLRWRDLLGGRRFTRQGERVRRRLVRRIVAAALFGGAAWWLAFGVGR